MWMVRKELDSSMNLSLDSRVIVLSLSRIDNMLVESKG